MRFIAALRTQGLGLIPRLFGRPGKSFARARHYVPKPVPHHVGLTKAQSVLPVILEMLAVMFPLGDVITNSKSLSPASRSSLTNRSTSPAEG